MAKSGCKICFSINRKYNHVIKRLYLYYKKGNHERENIMSFKYDLTAVEILKLLGYMEPVGKDALLQAEREKNLKLPFALFEFWSLAADSPLFETADIWTKKRDFFWFSYDGIQEWIDGDKAYWEKAPQDYANNEYYQLYKLPKEQWGSRVPNYLQIGSDFGAGISKFGVCLDEIGQENPPVYMLIEGESLANWKIIDDHLSDFLMRSICDVLCCGEYDTGIDVLEKDGWTAEEVYQEDFPDLDMDALLKQKSMYGADAVCGCAYNEGKKLLLAAKVDKGDSRNCRMMAYRKE